MLANSAEGYPSSVLMIPVDQLTPDPNQPRKLFLQEEIDRLAISMEQLGVLQPLLVRQQKGCWWIVVGERRWRAAKQIGLKEVPCLSMGAAEIIEDVILADQIAENGVRNALNAMDLANALSKLQRLRKCSQNDLADRTGLHKTTISKSLALFTLSEGIQTLVAEGKIPGETAYSLTQIDDIEERERLADGVAAKTVSRKTVNDAVRAAKAEARKQATKAKEQAANEQAAADDRWVFNSNEVSIALPVEPKTWKQVTDMLNRFLKEVKVLTAEGKEPTELFKPSGPVSQRNQPDNNGSDDATATAQDGE